MMKSKYVPESSALAHHIGERFGSWAELTGHLQYARILDTKQPFKLTVSNNAV